MNLKWTTNNDFNVQVKSLDYQERNRSKEIRADVETTKQTFEKKFEITNRSVTDKYWCGLFAIAFPVWVVSWLYAVRHRKDTQINLDNSIAAKDDIQDSELPFFLGKYWIVDALLGNVACLSAHYEIHGSVVIYAYVIVCGALVINTLLTMRNDVMFYRQLERVVLFFGIFSIFYRATITYTAQIFIPMYAPFLQKVQFWMMPDIVIMIILCIKKSYEIDFMKNTGDKMWPFRYFGMNVVLTSTTAICTLALFIKSAADIFGQSNTDGILFYVIMCCTCYAGLTIFYFEMMVISCAFHLSIVSYDIMTRHIEKNGNDKKPVFFLRAIAIVSRYHFGTACYHATLIFPRLETLFVSNEPKLKKLPNFSEIFDRIHLTQLELHSLSMITTVICGCNHSNSIRALSLVFSSDLPRLKYFHGFSQGVASLLAILISTNSLLHISLWAYGFDDPSLSRSTWMFYLGATFTMSMLMKYFDVAFNTIIFYMDHASIKYPAKRWVFVENCLIK